MDLFGALLTRALQSAAGACTGAGRAIIAVGEVALDDCCEGQVWARLITAVPNGTYTRTPTASQVCGVDLWDVTLGIGSARCAHTVDDQGNPPTPAQLCSDTYAVTGDMTGLMTAIMCDLAPALGSRRVRFLRWEPIGPEGGCVGGEWQISVLTDSCGCP